jgi:hypothetical protein
MIKHKIRKSKKYKTLPPDLKFAVDFLLMCLKTVLRGTPTLALWRKI